MKSYYVTIPITGYVFVDIQAESEDEAKEKAFNSDFCSNDIEEWSTHEKIVEGNVFYGMQNEIDIEEY